MCRQLIAVLVLFLWPLGLQAADSEEFLRDARSYFNKGEYSAAVIQLKNALLTDPDNRESRLLLGQTYLKLEDGLSAEKELLRARELGMPREKVLIPLGRAWLMTGQNQKLAQNITMEASDPLMFKVEILVLQGNAYLAMQDFAMAEEKYAKALKLQPDAAEALVGNAQIAYENQDLVATATLVDKAIAVDPNIAQAWVIKGELLRLDGKQPEAAAAFQTALDVAPTNLPARLGKATTLISLGRPEDAITEIDQIQKRYPDLYLGHYLKGLAYFEQQQWVPAQEAVQRALNQEPSHLPSHLLTGTISYQQGNLNQAEHHLLIYWNGDPGNIQAAKLLAATLLKLNKPAKAVEVLEPAESLAAEDAQYLALLGSAYLSDGETAKGLEILERAAAVAPDVAGIRTQLAIASLRQGDIDQAITQLQSAIDLGKDQVQADLLLAIVHLHNKDFDSAIAATEAIMAKMPDSPVAYNLKGAALMGKGDNKAARQSFEAALEKQPDFLPAYLNLAQIDMLEGNTAAAKKHYQKILSYDQGHLKTLVALARLAISEGNTEEATHWLLEARNYHPEAIEPALLLSETYLRQGQVQSALDVTRTLSLEHPGNPAVLMALALIQKKAGEDKKALRSFRSLVEAAPQSADAHYQLALVQYKLKQTDAARESLQQAISLQTDHLAAQLALGRLDIAAKDFDMALNIAAGIKAAYPDMPEGYELEGDVLVEQKKPEEAAKIYATAYEKSSSVQLARKIFSSRMQTGDVDAALKTLRNWLDEHPDDSSTRTLLASNLQQTGQRQLAIDEFLRVLEIDPDNVTALNNVAWLYQETGKSKGVRYAERAHELVPDRPEITDTLGWLLVQNGDINRGLVLLQEARIKAPHIPDIHYHMAVALSKAGRTDEARKELVQLLKTGKQFSGLEDAQALRDQLSNQ